MTMHRVKATNQRGQALGAKGARTRANLIESASRLIEKQPLRSLSPAEIAKSAGVSISAFYVYFQSVHDVFFVLAETAAAKMPDLSPLLDVRWSGDDSFVRAREVLGTIVDHNIEHYPIFRLRNHIADEGEERFAAIRSMEARPVIEGIARQIATRGQPDLAITAPMLARAARMARLLYGMTERVTILVVQHPYGALESARDMFIDAAARLMVSAVATGAGMDDQVTMI